MNIDHVATLRQARGEIYPEPIQAALLAESAGADGITVHLREDKRHIQPRDVQLLREVVQTHLNLEMAATSEMIAFATSIKPEYCCLVPEKREEVTTEGGLDVEGNFEHIKNACQVLMKEGIEVSLFIDPDKNQIMASKNSGATIVELQTGAYASATASDKKAILQQIRGAAEYAHQLGLQVNAGHGLHYHNVQAIASIPQIVELNIGHAIVAQALMVGFSEAVKQMKYLMMQARGL
jgi:pyridoxine 5-phosphate synthase